MPYSHRIFMHSPTSLAIISLITLSIIFATGSPAVHAQPSAPVLSIQPSSQTLTTLGGTVSYNIVVSNVNTTNPIAAWAIYIWVNASILDPVNFTLGPFVAGATQQTLCINDTADPTTLGSCTLDDGAGVVHTEAYSATGTGSTGNGTLFTITYKAIQGPGTPIIIFSDILYDTNGQAIAHTTHPGIYGRVGQPDFAIGAAPFPSIPNAYTIGVTGNNGFTGTVKITITATPGLGYFISAPSVNIGAPFFSDGITIVILSFPASGIYTLQATGTSGSLSHTTTVAQYPPPSFTVTANPSTIKPQDDTFRTTVTVTSIQGFAGTVTLSATVSPAGGLNTHLRITTITLTTGVSQHLTLRMSTNHNTRPGTYIVTVTGTSGSTVASTTFTVIILKSAR